MAGDNVIEVRLPEGMPATAEDLEVLRTTFQTIVTLTRECGCAYNRHLQQMQGDGWTVTWGLSWVAKAKRGDAYEEATGGTKEEALNQLFQMTRLHVSDGCP
jgi:hypothetical protein